MASSKTGEQADPQQAAIDAVPDRYRVMLSDLPTIVGRSEPTIRRALRDDPSFPVLARGWHGVRYVFDARAVAEYYKRRDEAKRRALEEQGDRNLQLRLELFGDHGLDGDEEEGRISPREQRELVEARLAALRLSERQGKLVLRGDVEARLGEVYDAVRRDAESLGERIARELSLPREERGRVDAEISAMLERLADKLSGPGFYRQIADAA